MKRLTLILTLISSLVVGVLPATAANGGVHPLRGRWDVAIQVDVDSFDVEVLVVSVAPDDTDPAVSLATGCAVSAATGLTAPMAMRAEDRGGGVLGLTFFTTVLFDAEAQPSVVRFEGAVELSGSGVPDDVASGDYAANFGEGAWEGVHHDRRNPRCGDFSTDLLTFQGDTYTIQHASDPDGGSTLFESYTRIVSSGMQVTSPSLGTIVAPPFTDIFSDPFVDFIEEFRFLAAQEDYLPPVGETFTFVLVDLLGDPIPGTEATDVWNGCWQGAPQNLQAIYAPEDHLDFSWDPVPVAPGFDPADGLGLYQIESNGVYGGITFGATTSHLVPWEPFGGFQAGSPDGFDFGSSLSEFGNGVFNISAIAFAVDVGPGGVGLACQVRDEPLFFEIDGVDLTVLSP